MWTSTLDLDPRRVLTTQLLGRFWPGVYFTSFSPLRVQNLPRQILPATTWVRVRNSLGGICGSDLHLIYTDGDLRTAPAAIPRHSHSYLGHEVVGEVIEIGDDVQNLRVGDRVVLQHGSNCLSSGVLTPCRSCSEGNYNLCERGSLPGPQPIGGGWSEEMLLHEQQLFPISPEISDEQAVLIEPTAVALHAVLRRVPQAGERVLIIGAGTIGLLTLQVVQALAPQAEISVMARYSFQVEQATRMGAAHIIYPQDSYAEVQRATNAHLYQGMLGNQMLLGGYDIIYDTIGSRNTLHHALRWARARSTVVLVGVSLHMMRIDLTPIWFQEVNLIGTLGHGMETWPVGSQQARSTFSIVAELIEEGQLHPEHLITHRFALNQYQQALTTATDKAQSRAIKVVFDYSLLPASVVPNVRASARPRRFILPPVDEDDVLTETVTSSALSETSYSSMIEEEESALYDGDEDTVTFIPAVNRSKSVSRSAKLPIETETPSPTVLNTDEPLSVEAANQPTETFDVLDQPAEIADQPTQTVESAPIELVEQNVETVSMPSSDAPATAVEQGPMEVADQPTQIVESVPPEIADQLVGTVETPLVESERDETSESPGVSSVREDAAMSPVSSPEDSSMQPEVSDQAVELEPGERLSTEQTSPLPENEEERDAMNSEKETLFSVESGEDSATVSRPSRPRTRKKRK